MTRTVHSWIRPIGWLLVLSGGHAGALGADLFVPKDFPTIQSAIGAAGAGDQVIVEPGVYSEAINLLGKPITVRSTNPNDHNVIVATVIDATGLANSVVSCKSGETGSTVIMGLTLTGGTGSKDTSGEIAGGGAHIFKSSPQFIRCRFVENSAVEDGGGLYVDEGGAVTLKSCAFLDNVAIDDGGAIAIRGDGSATIVDCVFANNAAADDGGAIRIRAGTVQITGSWFMDNVAGDQGGALFFHDQDAFATIAQSVFCGNDPNNITGPFSSGGGNLSPVSCNLDTDGDGLLDTWEITGRVVLESGMVAEMDLPDANPMRKDLYVEVDVMEGEGGGLVPFSQSAIDATIAAFADAPVDNPGGTTGITLHVIVDESDIPFDEIIFEDDVFDVYQPFFFGTPAERDHPDSVELLEAKSKAFRYCIFVNRMVFEEDGETFGLLGVAQDIHAPTFAVSLGGFAEDRDDDTVERYLRSTFMHEFGHALGLRHGGADDINYKPNHVSVMNYNFDELVDITGDFLSIDFSREAIMTLSESSLDENAGLPTANYANIFVPHAYQDDEGNTAVRHILLGSTTHDWNNDGILESEVVADLNWFPEDHPFASDPSADPSMAGAEEWPLLMYAVPPVPEGGAAGGCPGGGCVCKLTEQLVAWHEKHLPAPPIPNACPADINGDTVVDGADLSHLLGAWGPCGDPDACAADLTGDGQVDGADLSLLLGAWGPCE